MANTFLINNIIQIVLIAFRLPLLHRLEFCQTRLYSYVYIESIKIVRIQRGYLKILDLKKVIVDNIYNCK
jgi:hypothetical protein